MVVRDGDASARAAARQARGESSFPLTSAQELLLRAALLEGDAALSAWRMWQAENQLDTLDDASFQLLPQLYLNLQRLGAPEEPSLPKLRGVYRHAWLRSTVTLRAAAAAVERLLAAGTPPLLLGDIALRLSLDADPGLGLSAVDLHVDEAQLGAALTVLKAQGWTVADPALLVRLAPFVPAIVARHPAWIGTTLRLHVHPFALGCPRAAARELRGRARRSELEGRAVFVPDPTDLLILACLGRWAPDPGRACTWILEVVALAGAAGIEIDWNAWLERSRRVGLPICKALLEVHERFALPVPGGVIERATADRAARPAGGYDIQALMHDARPRPPFQELLMAHWRRYSAGSRSAGRRRTPIGLARYALLQCMRMWQGGARAAVAARHQGRTHGPALQPRRR